MRRVAERASMFWILDSLSLNPQSNSLPHLPDAPSLSFPLPKEFPKEMSYRTPEDRFENEQKSAAFLSWRRFVENTPDLPIGQTVRRGLADPDRLSAAEEAAYEAPFPTPESKAGAVAWPLLVPMAPDSPVSEAMRETRRRLAEWSKPAFVLFAPDDPILGEARSFFLDLLPTAREQPDVTIDDAGHFLQEEQGPTIARHVLDFLTRTS